MHPGLLARARFPRPRPAPWPRLRVSGPSSARARAIAPAPSPASPRGRPSCSMRRRTSARVSGSNRGSHQPASSVGIRWIVFRITQVRSSDARPRCARGRRPPRSACGCGERNAAAPRRRPGPAHRRSSGRSQRDPSRTPDDGAAAVRRSPVVASVRQWTFLVRARCSWRSITWAISFWMLLSPLALMWPASYAVAVIATVPCSASWLNSERVISTVTRASWVEAALLISALGPRPGTSGRRRAPQLQLEDELQLRERRAPPPGSARSPC